MSTQPSPSGRESSFRQVRRGYGLALGIIAALTLTAQLIIQHTLGQQLHDAEIINVAGRQRMLSQRIARSALELRAGDEAKREVLRADLAALSASHRRLMEDDLSYFGSILTPTERAALDLAASDLMEAGQRVVDGASEGGGLPPTSEASAAFLPAMDRAVFEFSAQSKGSILRTRKIEVGLALCTLTALLLEALLIFGPLLGRLRSKVRELEVVTDRLAESEARHERALAGSRDGLWDWDRRSGAVFFSPRFQAMAGLGEGAAGWAALEARLSPIDQAKLQAGLDASEVDVEARLMLDEGPRWMRLRGQGDGAHHMSGTLTDVDERRRLEDERTQLLEARERDLTEVRNDLARAEVMTAIGTLASGVAHDFNNYLQVIQMAADCIDGAEEDGPLLDSIKDAAVEAATLTRQLLSLRQEHSGEVLEVLDLGRLVQDSLSLVRPALPSNVDSSTEIARPLQHVRVDRGQLRQVLVNLCINARDAMPGGGALNVSLAPAARRSVDGEAPGIELVVEDEGHGMSPEVLRRVFDPFFTTKKAGKGTGLGLAMVHSIVRRHGGVIDAESEPGRGSRFRVWLPSYVGPATAKRARAHWRRTTETLQVLAVDDEPAIRQLARHILQGAGHEVLEAGSAQEAVRLGAAVPRLDLILCDVMMPDGLGPDAVARIREARGQPVPTVFVSGYTERPLHIDEASAFLRKPFTSAELFDAIDQVLSRANEPAPPG